jgi:hypothetical protein
MGCGWSGEGRKVDRGAVADSLRRVGRFKAAKRYEACGKKYIRLGCKFCGEESRVRFTCNVRICEECAREAAKRVRMAMVAVMYEMKKRGRFNRGWSWKLLTLTLRHDESVERRIRVIKREFTNLWRRFFKVNGSGCFYAVELGSGEHVHLHAVLYAPWRDVEELRRYWEMRTGAYIVDIRKVNWGLHVVANYVVKYMLKEAEGDEDKLVNTLLVMEGSRRVGAKGVFYGVKVVEEKRSVCVFCGQWDGWIPLVPFWSDFVGAPILTRTIWVVEFG